MAAPLVDSECRRFLSEAELKLLDTELENGGVLDGPGVRHAIDMNTPKDEFEHIGHVQKVDPELIVYCSLRCPEDIFVIKQSVMSRKEAEHMFPELEKLGVSYDKALERQAIHRTYDENGENVYTKRLAEKGSGGEDPDLGVTNFYFAAEGWEDLMSLHQTVRAMTRFAPQMMLAGGAPGQLAQLFGAAAPRETLALESSEDLERRLAEERERNSAQEKLLQEQALKLQEQEQKLQEQEKKNIARDQRAAQTEMRLEELLSQIKAL